MRRADWTRISERLRASEVSHSILDCELHGTCEVICYCESDCGCQVVSNGRCPHGCPSMLLYVGFCVEEGS